LLALIGERIPDPPLLRELLVVSIALLVDALSEEQADADSFEARVEGLPYSPFTLVDQAVHAAASDAALERGKGFVNAVLRTLLRKVKEAPSALEAVLWGDRAGDLARHELPSWWVGRLRKAYPSQWRHIVDASLAMPPLVVRVNRRRTTRDAYLERLEAEGIAARPIGEVAVRFEKPLPVVRIPGFADGSVSIQDEAAQRAAPLLDAGDGMRVLDACAAPGGKTGHLLERADVDLVALDSDVSRLARVRDNLDRLGLAAELVVGDAAAPATWWDGRPFDRILADVPCTASGILRRHPDIRWLRRESDISALSRTAQQITGALWSLLYPGGKLLLVTCSVFPEESAQHAASFAARHADAAILSAPGQLLPEVDGQGSPSSGQDHDGLFFALFEKMR
jgi:16S rRNA (cytosine967-C5)-methyltransferase